MVVEAIVRCVASCSVGLRIAVLFCVLLICGAAHAEPKLPLTLAYVPEPEEPWGVRERLELLLLRYRRPPELELPPFNALRGGLRTNELEDQRRARSLVRSDFGQRSRGAQSGLLDGDLASLASLAATYFSFNLTLRDRRRMPSFFMEKGGERPPFSVGVGLGRVGLGLRTEF